MQKETERLARELGLQLMLMGIGLLVSVIAIWVLEMPQWKRQRLMAQAQTTIRQAPQTAQRLSAKAEIEIREFRDSITRWDHDARSGNKRATACDNPAESD
jgi:hypothetical protein